VSPALLIDVDEPHGDSFKPGDWVRGRVRVVEGGTSGGLSVELRFRERTSDYSATAATYGQAQLHDAELSPGASFPFAIQLPPDCFPSFSTPNGELYYEVHARSVVRGPDTHADTRIAVKAR
jgi:hypothetical protein